MKSWKFVRAFWLALGIVGRKCFYTDTRFTFAEAWDVARRLILEDL